MRQSTKKFSASGDKFEKFRRLNWREMGFKTRAVVAKTRVSGHAFARLLLTRILLRTQRFLRPRLVQSWQRKSFVCFRFLLFFVFWNLTASFCSFVRLFEQAAKKFWLCSREENCSFSGGVAGRPANSCRSTKRFRNQNNNLYKKSTTWKKIWAEAQKKVDDCR